MATEAKRLCNTMVKIGTHNGTFHCDEALACFFLKQLPEFKDAEILRTRDQSKLNDCDVVVDVGGVFDAEKLRFDHHQRTFNESMHSLKPDKSWVTKLSSAGLVYLHYGERIISSILGVNSSDSLTKTLYDKMYEKFVEEIDAIDNGINIADGPLRYSMTTGLSARVSRLNPRWNEPCTDSEIDARFVKAMNLTGSEFVERLKFYSEAWWPARELVAKALENRFEVDPSGEVVCLASEGSGGCPWKDHLMSLEEEMGVTPLVKFVLYRDSNDKWRVQCVPKELESFGDRLSLLAEWRGLRDDALSELSGIPGCVFVHASGFIGGNQTYEGALEMARRTLQGKPRP